MSRQTKKLVILGGGSGIERYKEDIKRFDERDDVEILTYSLCNFNQWWRNVFFVAAVDKNPSY